MLARPDDDETGPLAWKRVEEVFVRTGRILHLHVGGKVIKTTPEHPFWVRGKGWVAAGALQAGDLLLSHDGQWILVEEVFDTGEYATVYNLEVADFHTYFVGSAEWGFDIWAHNTVYHVTPQGTVIPAPAGYTAVPAQNGKGFVLLPPGQSLGDNRNIIRYSDPTPGSSHGTIRYYNGAPPNGQPINPATGQPGSQGQTHIPENYQGPFINYPGT